MSARSTLRRVLCAALALGAALTFAAPAQAADDAAASPLPVTVHVDQVSPSVLRPGDDLTVHATLTNTSTEIIQKPVATLRLSPFRVSARDDLAVLDVREQLLARRSAPPSTSQPLPGPLAVGQSVPVDLVVPAADIPLRDLPDTWGPRGLSVEVADGRTQVGLERTFLLWFPDDVERLPDTALGARPGGRSRCGPAGAGVHSPGPAGRPGWTARRPGQDAGDEPRDRRRGRPGPARLGCAREQPGTGLGDRPARRPRPPRRAGAAVVGPGHRGGRARRPGRTRAARGRRVRRPPAPDGSGVLWAPATPPSTRRPWVSPTQVGRARGRRRPRVRRRGEAEEREDARGPRRRAHPGRNGSRTRPGQPAERVADRPDLPATRRRRRRPPPSGRSPSWPSCRGRRSRTSRTC